MSVPTETLKSVLAELEEYRLLIRAGDEKSIYVPARAPETISISEILKVVRMAKEDMSFNVQQLSSQNSVEKLIENVEGAIEDVLKGLSLRDLVLEDCEW